LTIIEVQLSAVNLSIETVVKFANSASISLAFYSAASRSIIS
jgi:hypothetical protein